MQKKRLISLFLASLMVLSLFAGCKTTPKDPTVTDPKDTPKTEGNVRTDIIIADTTDLKSLDPHKANDGYSARVFVQIYDSLLKQGPDLEIQPGLAESYEYKGDNEIIFHLRKDVKFHNGDALKASDVKFSVDRMVSSPQVASYFTEIDSTTVIDDNTVSIKTKRPYAPLLFNLAGTYGAIVSEKVVTEAGDSYGEKPVGTGPMMYKEWKANDHITLVRNDDYWKGQPKATSITIRVIPEDSMRTIALEAGDIDFMQATPPIDVARIDGNAKLTTVNYLSQSAAYVGFNCKKEPFDNPKVRQALNYAVNKQEIIDVVLEGRGQVINTMLAPDMPGANNKLNLYPYDVEKAKALLSEAGFPSGFSAEIVASGDANNKAAQLIQANFGTIGITVDINIMEFGAMLDYLKGTTHDMHILSYGAAGNPDSTMSNVFHSLSSSQSGNRGQYANPEVDKLIDKAKAELDLAKRNEIYMELQEMIMADAPIIPLYTETKFFGMSKNLDGVVICKNAKNELWNAVVKE